MKDKKQRYILTLKLETEKYQEDILNKRFELGRQLYNSVLGKSLKRYKEMIKTKRWRKNQINISNVYKLEKDKNKAKKLSKEYFEIKKNMLKEFNLSEYSLHADIKNMQKHFKKDIDSFTAQKIASNVWRAYDKLLYGNGDMVHFKKYNNGINSLEGKSNKTGIVYKIENNTLKWNGLDIKIQSKLNNYEVSALRDEIKYCRIVRKFARGKYKYSLQLILDGIPPIKIDIESGEIKNDISIGDVGIDIGTRTIAYVSDYTCKLYELAPRVQNIENEKCKLQRKLDRQRRANNPNNYNYDGTIKRGVKLEWTKSNKYIKTQNELREIQRKQADIRKQDHNIMANEIISQGDTIKVETMNYKSLQSRSKETTVSDKTGKYNKKKRFGKSLANKAPSMFLTILKNKVESKGGLFIEINTYKVKASQYNHLTGAYVKKELNQRWNYFNYNNEDIKIQRDIYSAYLIKNVDELESINNDKCHNGFEEFIKYHNKEILRLQEFKNLSSMGI
ncbi:transposase [Clostridium butyricum]|uniref:transposase n=1 Tax=Clostridium butyricum TaxID=1492 RepID=UPI003F5BF84B